MGISSRTIWYDLGIFDRSDSDPGSCGTGGVPNGAAGT